MKIDLITTEELQQFKTDLLAELKEFLAKGKHDHIKEWLKSYEVRKMLKISAGTLQNLRINGTLRYTKIGGILYYKLEDIVGLLNEGHS